MNESLQDHHDRIKTLEEQVNNLTQQNALIMERLFYLEEKERQRAREDHDREMALADKELVAMELDPFYMNGNYDTEGC